MVRKTNQIKVLPLETNSTRKCGVCEGMLVVPPIYSCKSASFICGPCFEGKRYYLDDDDLRATDNPIRQILYENYAREVSFPCSFYPHCKGHMHFDDEAKSHYKEYCFAKVLWIFKCPISRANRWYLNPDQKYCNWRYKKEILYEDENTKMSQHLKLKHSEYILERPYVLKLQDLKNSKRLRQIFLLLIEENSLVAAINTDVTDTEVIFRCRVNDSVDDLTAKTDPYECSVTLVPPNERFISLVDLKFECVRFDSNDVEYPWHSLRLPIRHLVEETSFKLMVLPRSFMLRSIPYLHRDRQLFEGVEEMLSESTLTASETGRTISEATMSITESNRTEVEYLSQPSWNAKVGFLRNNSESWEADEFRGLTEETETIPEFRQVLYTNGASNTYGNKLLNNSYVNRNLFHGERDGAQLFLNILPDFAPLNYTSRNVQPSINNNPFIATEGMPQLLEIHKGLHTSTEKKFKMEPKAVDVSTMNILQMNCSDAPSASKACRNIFHPRNRKTKKNKTNLKKYSSTQDLQFAEHSTQNGSSNLKRVSSMPECSNEVATDFQPSTYFSSQNIKKNNFSLSTRRLHAQEIVKGKNEQPGLEEGCLFRNDNIVSQSSYIQPIEEQHKQLTKGNFPYELYSAGPNLRVVKESESENVVEYAIDSINEKVKSASPSDHIPVIIFKNGKDLKKLLLKESIKGNGNT